jgi:hypothetical protein
VWVTTCSNPDILGPTPKFKIWVLIFSILLMHIGSQFSKVYVTPL